MFLRNVNNNVYDGGKLTCSLCANFISYHFACFLCENETSSLTIGTRIQEVEH